MNQYIEPRPYSLKLAIYANLEQEFLDDMQTMEQQIRQDLDKSFEKAMQDIPLGFYAEPPTVGFYEGDFISNTIRIIKESRLKRVQNLGELLFAKPIDSNE